MKLNPNTRQQEPLSATVPRCEKEGRRGFRLCNVMSPNPGQRRALQSGAGKEAAGSLVSLRLLAFWPCNLRLRVSSYCARGMSTLVNILQKQEILGLKGIWVSHGPPPAFCSCAAKNLTHHPISLFHSNLCHC